MDFVPVFQMYSVDILDRDMQLLDADEIFGRLMAVFVASSSPADSEQLQLPISVLTTQHRDIWSEQYNQLASR